MFFSGRTAGGGGGQTPWTTKKNHERKKLANNYQKKNINHLGIGDGVPEPSGSTTKKIAYYFVCLLSSQHFCCIQCSYTAFDYSLLQKTLTKSSLKMHWDLGKVL